MVEAMVVIYILFIGLFLYVLKLQKMISHINMYLVYQVLGKKPDVKLYNTETGEIIDFVTAKKMLEGEKDV